MWRQILMDKWIKKDPTLWMDIILSMYVHEGNQSSHCSRWPASSTPWTDRTLCKPDWINGEPLLPNAKSNWSPETLRIFELSPNLCERSSKRDASRQPGGRGVFWVSIIFQPVKKYPYFEKQPSLSQMVWNGAIFGLDFMLIRAQSSQQQFTSSSVLICPIGRKQSPYPSFTQGAIVRAASSAAAPEDRTLNTWRIASKLLVLILLHENL